MIYEEVQGTFGHREKVHIVEHRRFGTEAARLIHGRYTWDHNANRVIKLAQELRRAQGAVA